MFIKKFVSDTQRRNCWQNCTNMMKLAVQFECILRVHLNRTPSPHFQCWWIVLGCHMLAIVLGVNIADGRGGDLQFSFRIMHLEKFSQPILSLVYL